MYHSLEQHLSSCKGTLLKLASSLESSPTLFSNKFKTQSVKSYSPEKIMKNDLQSASPRSKPGSPSRGLFLMCFLCGRGFGTTSLQIHLPACRDKWVSERQSLPPTIACCVSSIVPSPPTNAFPKRDSCETTSQFMEQLQRYNDEAFRIYLENSRLPCKCGKKFDIDAFFVHSKACSMANQSAKEITSDILQNSSNGSIFLVCYLCGRGFGSTSLGIHLPNCQQKWKTERLKLPPQVVSFISTMALPKAPDCEFPSKEKAINNAHFLEMVKTFNTKAFQIYEEISRIECACGKRLDPIPFTTHIRSCSTVHERFAKIQPNSSSPENKEHHTHSQLLSCHLCGKRFGASSLQIHLENCSKKWLRDSNELSPEAKKAVGKITMPEGPAMAIPKRENDNNYTFIDRVKQYNQESEKIYHDSTKVPCVCGKKFDPSIFETHFRVCQVVLEQSKKSKPAVLSKPATNLLCYLCGKRYGTASLEMHLPRCQMKWMKKREMLPPEVLSYLKPVQAPLPPSLAIPVRTCDERDNKFVELLLRYNEEAEKIYNEHSCIPCKCGKGFENNNFLSHMQTCSPMRKTLGEVSRFRELKVSPNMITCYICGRQYSRFSMITHKPRCELNRKKQQSTLPGSLQTPSPASPIVSYTEVGVSISVNEYNNLAYNSWKR